VAERLTYYELAPDREGYVRSHEHEEFKVFYTSADAARAAGDVVFARLIAEFRAKIAAHKPEIEAAAAKRTWESEKRSACFVETRITKTDFTWSEGGSWASVLQGRLLVHTESRHRWRDVQMTMTVAKDGTATCTYAFGKPLPWSKWRSDWGFLAGGVHVPSHVVLNVRAVALPLAATRDELVAWARGGGETDA